MQTDKERTSTAGACSSAVASSAGLASCFLARYSEANSFKKDFRFWKDMSYFASAAGQRLVTSP
jgi:hypothetical protein